MLKASNKPAKPVSSSLSSSLKSERPGALIKHLQQLSTQQIIKAQDQKRLLGEQLESLQRKRKEYEQSDLAQRDLILKGIDQELNDCFQAYHSLEVYQPMHSLKQQDEDNLVQDLMELLIWLDEQVSLNNKMSTQQITNCAYMIVESFAGMTLEEVGLCFKQALQGQYGELYRLDTNTVLRWLRKYQQEKAELIRERNEQNHASAKADPTEERMHGPATPDKVDPTSYFRTT